MTGFFHPRGRSRRAIAVVLAGIMFLGPHGMAVADQPAKAQPDSSAEVATMGRLLPNAAVLLVVRPVQILESPLAQGLPYEVLQAACLKETGLDPLELQSLVVAAAPPEQGSPSYAVRGTFRGPVHLKNGSVTAHTEKGEIGGKAYLQSQEMMAPSFYSPSENTLIAAPDFTLRSFVETTDRTAPSPFVASCLKAVRNDDLYLAADLAAVRPFILMGLSFASEIPPEIAPLKAIPELVKGLEFRCNLTQQQPTELVITANDEKAADKLVSLVESAKTLAAAKAGEAAEHLLASSDPVEQAMGRYQQRMTKQWQEQVRLEREGDTIVLFRVDASNTDTATVLVCTAVIGTLVAMLLPAIAAAREAARRAASMNNMKQIELSLFQYEADHERFPPYASFDANGKPLLSWRVHVLPYLGEEELYEAFHLDEPWDSAHNKELIPQMPVFYRNPASRLAPEEGKTGYLGVLGKGCAFTGTKEGVAMKDVADGMSNTVNLVQVADDAAEVWTKPTDWNMAPANPMQGLGGLHPGGWLVGFMDGSIRLMDNDIDEVFWKACLTTSGVEAVHAGRVR